MSDHEQAPTAESDATHEGMRVEFDICLWDDVRDLKYALEDAVERRGGLSLPAVSDALTTVYMNRAARVIPPGSCEETP